MTDPAAHPGHSSTKPTQLSLLLIILPVVVIILLVVFWWAFQNIRTHSQVNAVAEQQVVQRVEPALDIGSQQSDADLTKQKTAKVLTPPPLEVTSEVTGQTRNGGRYWLFQIKNNGSEPVSRPGVMVSLFDQADNRLVEQGGWAYQTTLAPEATTVVLVFDQDAPDAFASRKITLLGSVRDSFKTPQLSATVANHQVQTVHGGYELVGDVVNPHQVPIKYIRVVAVALDQTGQPIGLGNAFSTLKRLSPGQQSGFKIRVGTFLTAAPVSWQLWAVASPES